MSSNICYICGARPGDTLDHIFPRMLFPKSDAYTDLPRRLPACKECNNALSKDEELFQQLVLSWRALDTPQARRVWNTKIRPNLRGKRPALRHRVLKHTEFAPLVNQLGKQFGTWPVLKISRDVADRVLKKMAKGLYYLEAGNPLPPDVEMQVFHGGQNSAGIQKIILPEILETTKKVAVGSEDILVYYRAVASDQPMASMTWFIFYRWNNFCVATLPYSDLSLPALEKDPSLGAA